MRHTVRCLSVALALLVLPFFAFAGGEQEAEGAGSQAAATAVGGPQEAPELAEMVAAGELPPLAERLPDEPFVVDPVERIGTYGGTWRRAIRGRSAWAFWGYVIKENEIRHNTDFSEIIPVIFKGYDVSSDYTTFTFYLREGLKWSDGDEMDADDYAFWWNDVILNDELSPAKPATYKAGDDLAEFEKIDQYTIRFTFSSPKSIFLHLLAQPRFGGPLAGPSHYLKQFHKDYVSSSALESAMEDGGFDTWTDLYGNRGTKHLNPELPGIEAWLPIDDNTGSLMRFERNPYYWKVDTEGNQLPYIDGIEQQLLQDAESCLLKALAGEIDFQYREVVGLDNYSVHMKNKDKSNYRLVPALTPRPNIYSIFTNYNTEDPVKRELYNDIRFRRALSLAINREEINQLLLKGLSEPSQASPPPGSTSYVREVAKMYTEFDLDRANELLDEIGLEWDNNRQWRLGPDGNRLQFVKVFYVSWPNGQAEAQDLIKQTWAQIGIDVVNKPIERSLWTEQMLAGEYDMSAYSAGGGASGPYLPLASNRVFPTNNYWYPEPDWGAWFQTDGQTGVEPPADAKRSYELYKEYTTTATSERMVEIEKEAYRLFVDNLWAIGVLVRPEREVYYVTHNRYRNVPDEVVDDVTYWHPASFYIEQ